MRQKGLAHSLLDMPGRPATSCLKSNGGDCSGRLDNPGAVRAWLVQGARDMEPTISSPLVRLPSLLILARTLLQSIRTFSAMWVLSGGGVVEPRRPKDLTSRFHVFRRDMSWMWMDGWSGARDARVRTPGGRVSRKYTFKYALGRRRERTPPPMLTCGKFGKERPERASSPAPREIGGKSRGNSRS